MPAPRSNFRTTMVFSLLGLVGIATLLAWTAVQQYGSPRAVGAGHTSPVKEYRSVGVQTDEAGPAPAPVEAATPAADIPKVGNQDGGGGQGGAARCENTCTAARNGVCDEGRPAAGQVLADDVELRVLCDLGTDCADCGAWDSPAHSPSWEEKQRPVELLQGLGYEMWVRRARTVVPFWMAYANWSHDVDVSSQMHHGAVVEHSMTKLFEEVLAPHCSAGKHGLFLDVGANFGWYSLLSAMMGCRVIAWEPVPHFRAYFEFGLALNKLLGRVDVRTTVVTHDSSRTFEMVVPQRGIWGTAGIGGANIDGAIDNRGSYLKFNVSAQRLDEQVREDVALVKVDVEGFEPDVWDGAKGLLASHTVHNVIMEYSPGVTERSQNWREAQRMPRMLQALKAAGLTILHLENAHDVNEAAKPLREVTSANLAYDLRDMVLMENGTLGCDFPKSLWNFEGWHHGACRAIPEDLNPRSFHSVFGHNTNIWATRAPPAARVGPPVGLLPLDAPRTEWFTNETYGCGGKPCMHLRRDQWVRCHCHCREPELCADQEKAVTEAALQGLMPQLYIIQ